MTVTYPVEVKTRSKCGLKRVVKRCKEGDEVPVIRSDQGVGVLGLKV